jgi:hypothetical protein
MAPLSIEQEEIKFQSSHFEIIIFYLLLLEILEFNFLL